MYSVQEFCTDIRNSAFGGSAEMVENGVVLSAIRQRQIHQPHATS